MWKKVLIELTTEILELKSLIKGNPITKFPEDSFFFLIKRQKLIKSGLTKFEHALTFIT